MSENTDAWEPERHDFLGKKSHSLRYTRFGFMKVWLVILSDQIIIKRRKNVVLLAIIPFVWDMSADDSFLQRALCYQHGGVCAPSTQPVLLCVLMGILM